MQNQIIYQSQPKKESFLQRICSCLDYFKKTSTKVNGTNYQLGIDSPKGSYSATRKMCVLDLDETLVHSQFNPVEGYDFSVEIVVQGQLFKVYVTLRPGAELFIEQLSEYYDIVLWTASLREYADPVMDYIDPQRRAITRMYRESCSPLKGGLAKNLIKLGKDLKDVVIIDNSQMSFSLQMDNGFQIKDFYNDKSDRELEMLFPFFVWLQQQNDVRPINLLFNQFISCPQSMLNSKRASFVLCQSNMDQQYRQYEEQLDQVRQLRKCEGKHEFSHSMTINKKGLSQQRVLTLQHNGPEDEIEMRDNAGLNSPHGEIAKQIADQTDDEEKETFEIGQ